MSELRRDRDLLTLDLQLKPKFGSHEHVYDGWPYVAVSTLAGERVLVLGALHGQTNDGRPVHRNCAIDGVVADDVPALATMRRHDGGVRREIRLLPYRAGMTLRFWTSVGGADLPEMARVVEVQDGRLEDTTEQDRDSSSRVGPIVR